MCKDNTHVRDKIRTKRIGVAFIYLSIINNSFSTENQANNDYILQTSTVGVVTAWYSLCLRAKELHCCPKPIKNT